MAELKWQRLAPHNLPEVGASYLIEAEYGAGVVHDVAFYQGKRPDGSLWWVMGNVEIDSRCITHFAEIEPAKATSAKMHEKD